MSVQPDAGLYTAATIYNLIAHKVVIFFGSVELEVCLKKIAWESPEVP